MPEVLEVVASLSDSLLIVSPHLFVAVINGDSTLEGTRAQSLWARKLASERPLKSTGCLVVLAADTLPPSAEMRKEIPTRLLEIASFASGFAIAIEADGFRGAALRGVFTSFLMVKRLPYRAEVFRTAREGLGWLSTLTPFNHEDALTQLGALRLKHGRAL